MTIRIAGTGSYLPGPPLDRDTVREVLRRYPDGLTPELQESLLEETGILTRHFAIDPCDESRRETNTSMAVAAGRRALSAAGWSPEDVDLLVVTTVVPDHLMPPTSTLVQEALGIASCAEMEISANCTAPYKGLAVAVSELELGHHQRALVCSSQFVSFLGFPPWMNPQCMDVNQGALRWIVSDGAGAIALERSAPDMEMRVWHRSMGTGRRSGMYLPIGAARPEIGTAWAQGLQHVSQDMRYVLKVSLRLAAEALEEMLGDLGVEGGAIDHFVPSVSSMQVAHRFQALFSERCGVRPESWRMNFTRVGYLGGVTLPVMLDGMVRSGEIRPGDLVCSFAEESSKWMCAGCAFRWNP